MRNFHRMAQANKSILITGANGFLGSRLCRKFLDEGFLVIAGVRKSADLSLLKELKVEYRYGDVSQIETLPEMVKSVDYVIHSAGLVKARRKQSFFDVNEKGTANLFEAVGRYNPSVRKVVYISSTASSGPSRNGLPVTEDDPPNPITTYGRSKLAGEKVALSYSNKFNVISIRPPGIYGPGDRETFPFFEAVYKKFRPIIGNPKRRLQLIEVDDLCRALVFAVTKDTPSGLICFAAENKAYTMKELIDLLGESCSREGFRLYIPTVLFYLMALIIQGAAALVGATPMLTKEKADELLASWLVSTERAEKYLGFRSDIDFRSGAKLTYDWYIKHGWLK
ncbi:MAG: NAD-dependent epimerase/dehydratase family protein [Candidatus Zixiibacteriota bacterium]